jgi:S-adenosylmethionine synthetase
LPVLNVSIEIETIGVAEPVSISIDTFKTGKVSEAQLVEAVRANFDLLIH